MGVTLSLANFKGGVGKTSTTGLVAYNLATRLNKKVLVIDFDAQGNLTSLMMKTALLHGAGNKDSFVIERTLMSAIVHSTALQEIILPIQENIDLIPNAVDFSMYTRFLEKNFTDELSRVSFFMKLVEPLKSDYDYIFIDVPPTLSLLNDTAFMACDQIVVVLQTQERSLAGAEVFLDYIVQNIKEEFHSDVDVLGILPVLSKAGVAVDTEILRSAVENWGEKWVFKNMITIMERVKRMDMTGITDNSKDVHDRNVHEKYTAVAQEILDRLLGV